MYKGPFILCEKKGEMFTLTVDCIFTNLSDKARAPILIEVYFFVVLSSSRLKSDCKPAPLIISNLLLNYCWTLVLKFETVARESTVFTPEFLCCLGAVICMSADTCVAEGAGLRMS